MVSCARSLKTQGEIEGSKKHGRVLANEFGRQSHEVSLTVTMKDMACQLEACTLAPSEDPTLSLPLPPLSLLSFAPATI